MRDLRSAVKIRRPLLVLALAVAGAAAAALLWWPRGGAPRPPEPNAVPGPAGIVDPATAPIRPAPERQAVDGDRPAAAVLAAPGLRGRVVDAVGRPLAGARVF